MSTGRTLQQIRHVGINVTPMIDLIMCLIIFFLLAAQLSSDEASAEVVLPKVRSTLRIPFQDRITVNIVPAEGRVRYVVRGYEYTLDGMRALLDAAASRNPNVVLSIRAHTLVRYDDIQGLMRRAADARIREIVFAVADAGA